MIFADVIIDISVKSLDRPFQYIVPEEMEFDVDIGSVVKIPFGMGNRTMTGYVVGLSGEAKFDISKTKSILEIIKQGVVVESHLLSLAYWIKENYGSTMNDAIKSVMPVKREIKEQIKRVIYPAVSMDKMREKSRAASERKQQQVAQVEARKELLACAPVVIDAKTLKHDSGDCGDVSAGRFVSFPGCYVAITYGEKFSGKHIAEYREARVFYSDNMGRSIIDDIEGRGDADIYADVKYGQGVRFYLFPCDEENSAKLLESLSQVLVEDDSVEARA